MRNLAIASVLVACSQTLIAAEKQDPAKDPAKLRHWAFQSPVRPEPPAVKNDRWISNPIDRFVLARLEGEGQGPAPEADRITLIRRLSLDLIGLPPAPEEVVARVLLNLDETITKE